MKEILLKVKVFNKSTGRIFEVGYPLYIPQYEKPMLQNFPLDLTNYDVLRVRQYTDYDDCKRTERYPEGQPIYEGDVVIRRCEVTGDEYDGFIGVVKFIDGSASYVIENFEGNDCAYLWDDVSDIEVIGNIDDDLEKFKIMKDERGDLMEGD